MIILLAAKIKARMQAQGPGGRGVRALQLLFLLLAVCIGLTCVQPALAADTGAKTAGAIVATGNWSKFTVETLASPSGSVANPPTDTSEGIVSTFGFGIPAGAQIEGIEVHVYGQSDSNNKTATYGLELSGDGGTTWTSTGYTGTFNDIFPFENHYHGGSSDDWGWASAGWDGDNFSDTPGSYQFQLKVWNTTTGQAGPRMEQIEVTVWYADQPQFTQESFRARNDDGDEDEATWKKAADLDWNQVADVKFRVRFLIQHTGGSDVTDKSFQLQYRYNGGSWADVTGSSSYVKAVASGTVSDGTNTTEQLNGDQAFLTGDNYGFDGSDGLAGGGPDMDFIGANDEVELEYCLQIVGTDVSVGESIELRVFDASSTYVYTETPLITVADSYKQEKFRGRNDDGDETGATWKDLENTNWTQAVGENFRVRFLIQEITDQSQANKTFQLEYSLNSGSWTDVDDVSSVVKAVASDTVADGTDTTEQMSGSQTFKSPNDGFEGGDGLAGGNDLDFGSGLEEVELEFSLMINGGYVNNNDSLKLRIKALETYSNTPTITVEDCAFSRYRKITIQASKVPADQTDFPVMIKLTGADFQSIEDDVSDADGDDIIFRDAIYGNMLDHEIEVYDPTNDILVAWVRVPSLSGSSNTDIYMFYGNECITTSTQNAPGVWSNGYEAVYHLHDDWNDSTGSHNGTGGQTQGYVSGQIANGVDFEGGNSDYINIGTWSVTNDKLTLQAWVKYESFSETQTILDKSSGTSASQYVWGLSTDRAGSNYRPRFNLTNSMLDGNGSTNYSTTDWYFYSGQI